MHLGTRMTWTTRCKITPLKVNVQKVDHKAKKQRKTVSKENYTEMQQMCFNCILMLMAN